MNSRFTQPAIFGGLVVGVLSALPFVSAGNWCCCLWVVCGGVTAAYLLQQNQSTPISAGDGALAGVLAGVVGAFVCLLLSIPITILMAPLERALIERMSQAPTMPPEWRNFMSGPMGASIGLVIKFLFMLFAGPVFSAIGGLLGAAIFRKPLPPLVVDVPGGPGSPAGIDAPPPPFQG
jgi:hypothetical protein